MATSRLCSIPDCGKPHYGLGYCRRHWARAHVHNGDPRAGPAFRGEPLAWLLRHATYTGDDCLRWPFAKGTKGRGTMKLNGKTIGAHRAMCILVYGEPPTPAHEAAHSCGNGHLRCVNPRHLRWATSLQNAADAIEHGRSNRGERNRKALLSEVEVLEIFDADGTIPRRELADRYGVARGTIANIQSGQNWGWLTSNRSIRP